MDSDSGVEDGGSGVSEREGADDTNFDAGLVRKSPESCEHALKY